MKIKKVEICGFKSFVDRTVIVFDHDITAIVGPNGCGKSNVVDAIRWTMGEQSAKNLRGKSMDDVIFNGSETRGPHSFAEVTIVFDNTDSGTAHDVDLHDASGAVVFNGEPILGVKATVYDVDALPAGSYTFVCSLHPSLMSGTATIK